MNTFLTISIMLNVVLLYLILTKNSKNLLFRSRPSKTSTHIVVYGTMKCGYTVKLLDELRSHRIAHSFVDTSTTKGSSEYSKFNVKGIPLTVCLKNRTTAVGYMPINHLMKKLGYN